MNKKLPIGFILILLMSFLTAFSQDGKMLHLTIHAVSLEENLVDESLDLSLGVYLPPGYEKQSNKRYPVVYWLHGYSGWKNTTGKAGWDQEAVITINKLINSGAVEPMIFKSQFISNS